MPTPFSLEAINLLSKRLITDKMPDWLKTEASHVHAQMRDAQSKLANGFDKACATQPDIARQLMEEYGNHRKWQAELDQLLKQLPDLRQFAISQLKQGLKLGFGLELDVEKTYLFNACRAEAYQSLSSGDPIETTSRSFRNATQSLLHSAMQNFEAAQALAGGLDTASLDSIILDSDEFLGVVPTGNTLEIDPAAFATLSRTLDIGGQYLAQVEAICQAGSPTALAMAEVQASTLRLELHRALLGNMIEKPLYEALLKLVEHGHAEYQGNRLGATFLQLFGSTVTGALVVGIENGPGLPHRYPPFHLPFQRWLVTYLPGAQIPLKWHSSQDELQGYLREQLWSMTREQLTNSVPARESTAFFTKLLDCLQPVDWSKSKVGAPAVRARDPDAKVVATQLGFGQSLCAALVAQKQQRLKDDAMFHAVPTAREDQITAEKHMAYYTGLAFDALFVGSFIFPALGPLMLGLTAVQLGHEVYEGLESWSQGDRQQALEYLIDVVEAVAQMAALGAVDISTGKPALEQIQVETPSFIEELEPVQRPDGEIRLWTRDLQPFAHDTVLPAGLKADEFGLYHHAGKTWLALEDRVLSVTPSLTPHEYALEHPFNSRSYQPRLRHNGNGAWLEAHERPHAWPLGKLLRRASHLTTAFSDATLGQILEVSGTDEPALRLAICNNLRLPALLEDTLARFSLDHELRSADGDADTRRREFELRYGQWQAAPSALGQTLRGRYPQLPGAIVEELLRNARAHELQALGEGKVERRLAEEIRIYQQQVRLARAYEGLYLDTTRNWDADRLILHSLQQLPGWPSNLSIALELHAQWPADSTRIGAPGGDPNVTILSTDKGYIVLDSRLPNAAVMMHGSLYSALGGLGVVDAEALNRLLRKQPSLPRQALRKLLRMQPVRPDYRSPMRLADGRLGYPLGGMSGPGNHIRRPTLLRMINQTGLPRHTPYTAAQILSDLEGRGLTPSEIHDRLLDISRERNALNTYLEAWRDSVITPGQNAQEIHTLSDHLVQSWYDHALQLANTDTHALRLEDVALDTFPRELPAFFVESFSHLQLIAPAHSTWMPTTLHLNRVLGQFSALRSLEISHPTVEAGAHSDVRCNVESITHLFPALESLSLINQNLVLTSADFDCLRSLPRLRRLILDGNQILRYLRVDIGGLTLDHLSLERMSLHAWPQSLSSAALERIGALSLRHNRIRTLPSFLYDNEPQAPSHTAIFLQANPLIEDQLLRIQLSQEGTPQRIHFDRSDALNALLRRYTERREALREALDNWVNASSSTAPLSQVTITLRHRIGTTLTAFWRGQELGSRAPLRLNNIALEHFPQQLPLFFYEHVRALSLVRISSTTAQLDELLGRFTAVESLNLIEHTQPNQELPSALLRLPRLAFLSLRDMHLEINNNLLAIFAQLTHLNSLELSGNRLGDITHVPEALSRLRRLDLNNMNIRLWPNWVDALLPLDLLDLIENQLTELPEHILSNPRADVQVTSISLFDNPLSEETISRVRTSSASQRTFTFAINPPDGAPLGGHLHNPAPIDIEDLPRLERWQLGTPAQNEALLDAWQQLQGDENASNLLALVGRLQQSAPYRNGVTRAAFCERVRIVLIRALVDREERGLFNQIAAEGLLQDDGTQTCHDGVLLVFQNLELLIKNRHLLTENADAEQTLYQELRRLYRLNRLDEMARDRAGGRDEAEVRLAYRRGANKPLQLGVPDDDMLFEAFAEVSHDELTQAMDQLLMDERGHDFLEHAANSQEWHQYLRVAYAEQFNAIEQQYQDNVIALPDQHPEASIEDLTAEYEALLHDKTEQEKQLVRELTALANPDSL